MSGVVITSPLTLVLPLQTVAVTSVPLGLSVTSSTVTTGADGLPPQGVVVSV